jgi:hypothetical protein
LNIASGGTEIRFFGQAALGEQTLMEGFRTAGQLPKRPTRLPRLGFYGWGARLTTEDETQILADSVEDRGCVYYSRPKLFGRPIPASLSLRTPVEPSQEHSVKVWTTDECNPARIQSFQGSDLVTKSGGQIWEITRELPKLNAISVAYRGQAIGQWWDKEEIVRVIKGRQSAEVFALLRWFKVPVLSTQLAYNMQGAVHRDPVSFLRAWLLSEELPEGLSQKHVDEGVKSVVRHFLWGWRAKPYMVKKMFELLARASGQVPPGVDAGLLRAAEICPSLIWQNQFYIMSQRATALREFLVRQDEQESQSSSKFHKPQEPVRRRSRAYGKQIDDIKSALSSDEFSVMIIRRENRRLGETQEGRRMLSVLILEEIEKRATQY